MKTICSYLIFACFFSTISVSAGNFENDPLKTPNVTVQLHSFDAIGIDAVVSIRWVSSQENNCEYFTIERSSNGISYIEIARMDAAGNSSSLIEYLLIDNDPLPGTSYYRIRFTNRNGEYERSEPLVVARNDKMEQEEIRIADSLYNVVSEDIILVRDKEGLEYFSKVLLIREGGEIIAFDEEGNIPPGEYFVIASSRNFLRSSRIKVK